MYPKKLSRRAQAITHSLDSPWSVGRSEISTGMVMGESKLAKKATKHSDAVMTGILVTRFKMGQINIEDLEQMASDASRV